MYTIVATGTHTRNVAGSTPDVYVGASNQVTSLQSSTCVFRVAAEGYRVWK